MLLFYHYLFIEKKNCYPPILNIRVTYCNTISIVKIFPIVNPTKFSLHLFQLLLWCPCSEVQWEWLGAELVLVPVNTQNKSSTSCSKVLLSLCTNETFVRVKRTFSHGKSHIILSVNSALKITSLLSLLRRSNWPVNKQMKNKFKKRLYFKVNCIQSGHPSRAKV